MSDKQGLFKTVVDSAVVIGVFSGFCYLLGSLARVRAYRSLGMPRDLVPIDSPQAIVSVGATYMILLFSLALLSYVLWVGLVARISASWFKGLRDRCSKAYEARGAFYNLFFVLVLMTGVLMTPLWVPASFQSNLTDMTRVRQIEFNDTEIDFGDVSNLRFICRSRGLLVFKDVEQNEVLAIPEDQLRTLTLDVSESTPIWEWFPWHD